MKRQLDKIKRQLDESREDCSQLECLCRIHNYIESSKSRIEVKKKAELKCPTVFCKGNIYYEINNNPDFKVRMILIKKTLKEWKKECTSFLISNRGD